MSDTLILNASYEPLSLLPLSIIPWQRAIKLLYLDRVQVIEHYDDWFVNSPSIMMKVPAIVVTTEYFDFKKTIRFSKQNVYLRDLYTCQFCEEPFSVDELTIDHVKPKSKGGKTTWENCVTACVSCNARKADKLHMMPVKMPEKPDYRTMAAKLRDRPVKIKHPSWEPFLEPYRKIA